MPYAENRTYCDADSHIMETVDWVSRHADPEIRARLPEMSLIKSATATFDFINDAVASRRPAPERGEQPRDVVHGAKGWNAYGAFDPKERSARARRSWISPGSSCSRRSRRVSTCSTPTWTFATAASAPTTARWRRSARTTRA